MISESKSNKTYPFMVKSNYTTNIYNPKMPMKPKLTLAIESSCDDTSLAIVRKDDKWFWVDKIVTYSQLTEHIKYWWVVPELAYRIHEEKILKLVDQIWREEIQKVDNISVTAEPWLMWSLMIGLTVAYWLGKVLDKPVIEVNHIYGHIFSMLLERDLTNIKLPMAVLTVSWWHNEIYIIKAKIAEDAKIAKNISNIYNWNSLTLQDLEIKKIWHTLDDAAGESFDKVARMLGGTYPWWPRISSQALLWKYHEEYIFPKIRLDDDRKYDFSFSGMKSRANQIMSKFEKVWVVPSEQDIYDICWGFQEAVNDTLLYKLEFAIEDFAIKTVAIVWWVSANDRLFEKMIINNIYDAKNSNNKLSKILKSMKVENISQITSSDQYLEQLALRSLQTLTPDRPYICRPTRKLYSTDNAAMIWVVWLMN